VGGEQFVLLPRAEYERLSKAVWLLAQNLPEPEPALDCDGYPPARKEGESLLRTWRKYRGMTLQELGDAVGKPKSFVSNIELGKSHGKPALWRKFATALQIDVEAILPEED
jgi:DNA-binding XRE family transcriptional regulator